MAKKKRVEPAPAPRFDIRLRGEKPKPFVRDPNKVYSRDIRQFTRHANYRVDVPWSMLERHLVSSGEGVPGGFNMDPDYQRAHVWTEAQQVAYIEYVMRGGMSGRDIYTNCRGWQHTGGEQGPFELVDGKQRLTAILRFMRNEIPAFGHKIEDYGDEPDLMTARVSWWVNDLPTRTEVLTWYLEINAGGTQHTSEEIGRAHV